MGGWVAGGVVGGFGWFLFVFVLVSAVWIVVRVVLVLFVVVTSWVVDVWVCSLIFMFCDMIVLMYWVALLMVAFRYIISRFWLTFWWFIFFRIWLAWSSMDSDAVIVTGKQIGRAHV